MDLTWNADLLTTTSPIYNTYATAFREYVSLLSSSNKCYIDNYIMEYDYMSWDSDDNSNREIILCQIKVNYLKKDGVVVWVVMVLPCKNFVRA